MGWIPTRIDGVGALPHGLSGASMRAMTNTFPIPIARSHRGLPRLRGGQRWRWYAALALSGVWGLGGANAVQAQTQTWFFVDNDGVLHYANERVDARYHRFSMNDLVPGDGPLFVDIRAAASHLAEVSEKDRSAAQRYFANSAGYKLHAQHIRNAAQKHGVDEQLLKAIATAESGFNAGAVSPKGAVGLMQVIPDTAARFGVSADAKRTIAQKLKDPAINVPASARYVRYLEGLFPGRTDLVVAAYNAGEGAVQRYGNKIPPYKETQNYVKTVMTLYASLQSTLAANPGVPLYGGSAQLTRSPVDSSRFRMTIEAGGAVKH